MKRLFILASALLALTANAQTIDPETVWTDGSSVYVLNVELSSPSHLDYVGGTLHEGGLAFGLDRVNGKYILSKTKTYDYDAEDGNTYFGPRTRLGYEVTLETIGNRKLLVARDEKGTITDVLEDLVGELYDKEIDDIHIAYAGEYVDYQKKSWTFGTDGTITMPGKKTTKYTIIDIYDMPSNIITVDNKNFMEIEVSTTGLNIYECNYDSENEDSNRGKLIAKLRRKSSPFGEGLCPYTSTMLINASLIGYYDNKMLRIVRNEIWARHGYRFSSADLQEYFNKQSWYKPVDDNSTIELSPLEKMNIAIIKSLEDYNRDWVTTEQGL